MWLTNELGYITANFKLFRDSVEDMVKEARTLMKLNHENIVKCYNIFPEFGDRRFK